MVTIITIASILLGIVFILISQDIITPSWKDDAAPEQISSIKKKGLYIGILMIVIASVRLIIAYL
ncbi:MAG: hypothetical protein ACLFR1_00220 [Spirochaetia bacterium]